MFDATPDDISRLIEPGRVHRSVYTDPDIFALEMERIFGRAWLFVAHESQLPSPGDFITTEMGRQPVIVIRHGDGTVRVLLNRCSHRGAKVCNTPCGNTRRLTCLYHGWSYDTDGTLLAVPIPEGSAADFNMADFGLAAAPRVATYRGFVFASLSGSGPELDDHLGPMKANIDDLVDRAPDGAIALDAGVHRYRYRGNWKLQIENVLDSYHVPFSHASTVNRRGEQFSRREGDEKGARVIDNNKRTADTWKQRRSYVVSHGHGWTSNTALNDAKRSSPAWNAYKAALAARVGAARAEEILTPKLHNSLIYPNVSVMGLNIHVRVIRPIAVDLTEVNVYPVRLLGAPDEMNARNIRLLNVTHSAASFVQTDDLEAFVRTQNGLRSHLTDWVDVSRGLGAEEPDPASNVTRESAMHEMVVRGQYKAWLDYMREAA